MSRKFSKNISVEELEMIILKTLEKKGNFVFPENTKLYNLDSYDSDEKLSSILENLDVDYRSYKDITPTVEKDLSKVEFDTENCSISDTYGRNSMSGLLGLNTLSNGLSFLGINAGGDWEVPIFYIIYFDGYKLRGYIPEDGNPWNTKSKMSYGNDEESDEINLEQRGWESTDSATFDSEKIKNDILNRITSK